MERTVYKASGHQEARRWDIEQQGAMMPEARLRAARALKDRAYGRQAKDVRACHPSE